MQVVYGLFLDSVEIALTFTWKRNPGAHPGWSIGLEILFLGLMAGGLAIVSANWDEIHYYEDADLECIEFLLPGRLTIIIFLTLATVTRAALLVCASIDTHRQYVASTVERYVSRTVEEVSAVLRRQNYENGAAFIDTRNFSYGYHNLLIQTQELPEAPRFPQELSNESPYQPELPGSTKFPVELSNSRQMGL
ncbi:hypothetical protein GGR51DRAFT_576568 [Nemania sp. FL0031]|nr:hypothetical protein GGR51DRAFT_576568 [Nemania sp. FL0031]